MFVKNGTGELKKVLLSRPTFLKPAPINEIAKKWKNTQLDVEKMEEEHQLLVKTYLENGVEVEFLEADKERPNAVFARDFGGCVKEGYILGNFSKDIRSKEHEAYKRKMEELGIPIIASCKEGYFEGGDFAFLNENTIAIGMMDRTNEKGIEEIRESLSSFGYKIIPVKSKREYLHLDMCFNLVDDHLAIAYINGLPESFLEELKQLDIEVINVSKDKIFAHGCNVQAIGNKRVIALKKNEDTNEIMRQKGMNVIELDITEILKAGGGPHCMTFPLHRI